MKKRKSRSTSGPRKTSSRSGTSGGRTAGTAGPEAAEDAKYKDSPFAYVLEAIRKMTPEEFRESLIRAGIVDHNGELTPTYRR